MSYGRMLLNIGFRAVAGLIPGGALIQLTVEEVGPAICEALWSKLKKLPPEERRQAVEELGQVSVEEARALAEESLAEVEVVIEPELRARTIGYLSTIPMTTRRTLVAGLEEGGPTLPATQIPTGPNDLLRLLPARPPRFEPGYQIPAHDFRLERLLGQGGFGEVWLARNPRRPNQAPRALKFCLDEEMISSLERETVLLDRVEAVEQHPGIVRLLQTALSADPPFLVYEYVEGGDLTTWLALEGPGAPHVAPVVEMLAQLADALAFAHDHGIVHRDLKPSNLLVDAEGRLHVADFGIGAFSAERELQAATTRSAVLSRQTILQGACTPMYADRAQRRGEAVDARADLYAVGVIAYQLLLGDTTLELSPYFRDELTQAGVPDDLLDVVSRCLAAPARRFADGAVLLEALRALEGGAGVAPRGPAPAPRVRRVTTREAKAPAPAPAPRDAANRAGPLSAPPGAKAHFWRWTGIWGGAISLAFAAVAEQPIDWDTVGGVIVLAFACGALVAHVLRRQCYEVAIDDPDAFFRELRGQVAGFGYHRFVREGDEVTFSPGFWAGYASGKIIVQLESERATVTGPSYHLKKLHRSAIRA